MRIKIVAAKRLSKRYINGGPGPLKSATKKTQLSAPKPPKHGWGKFMDRSQRRVAIHAGVRFQELAFDGLDMLWMGMDAAKKAHNLGVKLHNRLTKHDKPKKRKRMPTPHKEQPGHKAWGHGHGKHSVSN